MGNAKAMKVVGLTETVGTEMKERNGSEKGENYM
jgi:hypothetical protein